MKLWYVNGICIIGRGYIFLLNMHYNDFRFANSLGLSPHSYHSYSNAAVKLQFVLLINTYI